MSSSDTIFALSSGHGVSGICVIRVSGSQAGDLIRLFCGKMLVPRRASVSLLTEPHSGRVLDQAVVIWWPAPHSFTGEDVAEFQLHGSRAVVEAMLSCLGSFDGLRPADPGEFTRRAFVNQRIDLVEAEGLADLLAARSVAQHTQAMRQMLGEASSVYENWRSRLLRILAMAEAAIDFDEEGVGGAADAFRIRESVGLRDEIEAALSDADRARRIRDGVRVVLAGFPNVGKSSLLNALARRDAAIVSPLAGTTRDTIEVSLVLDGHEVIVTDTAGLRGTSDDIETIGVARALAAASAADILIWVASPDVAKSEDVWPDLNPDILVRNKSDLGVTELGLNRNNSIPVVGLSAILGNCGELIETILSIIATKYQHTEHAVVTRERHVTALRDSIRLINESLRPDSAPEFVAEDLRNAAAALGRITGVIGVEDVLGAIFSEFCIGK
ncbi:tRNA uridine-5-carboxymethylaminomethyl(34) synthesis GTPase MnmE [Aestuariivirga sp.]|uniref:tRNA uridine-5-carboxymethylaminomethyl(34) synthesis GTPase MnmE n=1 Tax=Aestuariivirga sp. TaxID=2650926 RepID=UPI0039E4F96B